MAAALTGALAALSGCSTQPIAEGRNRFELTLTQEYGLPVTSLIGRRFETVVRQQYDFSCGSAALATLLRFHYADAQSEQSVFVGMFRNGDQAQIRRQGFSLLDMKRYLADRGISADGYRVSLDQIVKARTPGIALIDYNGYRHFVVVKGIEGDTLLLGDPSLGLRRESRRVFQRQWNGVFFVLNGRTDIASAHFNQGADRARAPMGRFYTQAQPLNLAGLAMTRPILGEF
ncbi:MAG: C39 family peptidase [Sphingobium sp.]|nr:C39 family peptidase [Sphingobium sp.]MBP6112457.1 C39 family peptidase [Sphingobium sp.]MBP8671015.1 C39 family peptidase [Sphingobium sp.]MBP9158147.1 C39 family peptidase [Sphingobium sp.]